MRSSPVMRATASARAAGPRAVVVLAREQAKREPDHAGAVSCMRSMAKYVLPVLVGPSRAITGAMRGA